VRRRRDASGHRDPRPHRRRVGRTLRSRLTLSLVAVLLAACALTGLATALSLRSYLLGRLDAQLAGAGGRFSLGLEHPQLDGAQDGDLQRAGGTDGAATNAGPGQSVGTVGVRLLHGQVAQAAVVSASGQNRAIVLPAADVAALRALPVGRGARSAHLTHLGEYRLEAVAGRDGDVQITGLPLHEVDETVARLLSVEGALFALAVAGSGAVTAVVVGRTLRPLRRVADTARHVSQLPLTDPDTPLPAGIAPAHPTTEVDQVSVAFDRMLDHVRRALAARDLTEQRLRRFVADASHELRTPLATIRAHAEYAARTGGPLPETTATALARIDAAAIRMAALVDDLLLLARLDAGRPLARARVDLTQLVVEAVSDARTTGPDHRWRLDLPEDPVEVTGDGERLNQVVANLLSNARHHTPAATTVTTTVRRTASGVSVEVGDDGPGIAAELLLSLFDRFTRGDASRTAGHGSTGLGLAIAESIAHAHHGTLGVDSRPGHTAFRLQLPSELPAVAAGADVEAVAVAS